MAKPLAAFGLGLAGSIVGHLLARGGALADPLRAGLGIGGCGGARLRAPEPVAGRFRDDPARRSGCATTARAPTLLLAKRLTLAFVLESLMQARIPAETVTAALGGTGLGPIATATLVGVPADRNGVAALPLVGGLIGRGVAPVAGMAALTAGGVTSIPAAMAVRAPARPPVFGLSIALSLASAFAAAPLFRLWTLLRYACARSARGRRPFGAPGQGVGGGLSSPPLAARAPPRIFANR